MLESLMSRLEKLCDGEYDLTRLLLAYLNDNSNDYEQHSRKHFDLVKCRDPRYMDHGRVLALSFGGSNTKLVLASTVGGIMHIHHMRALKKPEQVTHLYDLLDDLLIRDAVVYKYLTESDRPVLSVVIPVMIGEDGIPQHPAKMPTITGLLARCEADFTEEMNFNNNMKRYFSSRGLKMPHLYYQSDPIAAHIGGLSQITKRGSEEETFLLVCGTGMATADDHINHIISRMPVMTFDEELFPKEKTEGYIYESGCSGLLFYGLMQRAVMLRKHEPGSALAPYRAEDFFVSSDDSELVCRIWESALDTGIADARVAELRSRVDMEAFIELQEIAALLMQRLHLTLANAAVATAVKLNRDRGFRKYHVIFEGSVALNPNSYPRILSEIDRRLKNKEFFDAFQVPAPVLDAVQRPQRGICYDDSVEAGVRKKMELSLIGTAVLGITDAVLNGIR